MKLEYASKPAYCELTKSIHVDAKNIQVTNNGRTGSMTCFKKKKKKKKNPNLFVTTGLDRNGL